MNYREKSTQLALDSSVAVYVLANADCTDVELLQLKPRTMSAHEAEALRDRWHGRGLDSVGVMGLVGTSPRCALKEPLGPERESLLMSAFLEYLHGLFCDSYAEEKQDSLHRWHSLPDMRTH
ncbi:hypothetical protein [Occallatibacter savannae]|uniref:hypothetical protein n=1 Tax=Occallatibacter savannae TaxID=1002691 RepID=UPI000D69E8BA|nr:hypothetical protein [Occallatibacter savannae]